MRRKDQARTIQGSFACHPSEQKALAGDPGALRMTAWDGEKIMQGM